MNYLSFCIYKKRLEKNEERSYDVFFLKTNNRKSVLTYMICLFLLLLC